MPIFVTEKYYHNLNKKMNKKIFEKLQQHCTDELCTVLLNAGITISDSEGEEWEVSEILDKDFSIDEIMKLICCFSNVGGIIMYNGEFTPYAILCKILGVNDFWNYKLYWIHSEANGMIPIYDIGKIGVPKILPKYATEEQDDGFHIVRLYKGEYIPLKGEIYPTIEIAKQRTEELNLTRN